MNILFASDMSFSYMSPEDAQTAKDMQGPAALFARADFSVVNLENIFGNKDKYTPIAKCGPNLISSDHCIEYIKALNPSVVGLANNHAGDYGEKAMYHTINLLNENGYPTIGAGATVSEAYTPFLCEKDGVRVGIIAVCENEFGCAAKTRAGSAGYNLTLLKNQLKSLNLRGIKPVVYFHGGNEKNPFPSPGAKELYRHFIDLGAAAVVAMHTHCPQGFEMYNGCPIVYSMGNFFFPLSSSNAPATWFYGYMTELVFEGDKTELAIHPYHFDGDGITLLKGRQLDFFNQYVSYLSSVIADDKKLCDFFDAWCTKYGYEYAGAFLHFDNEYLKDNAAAVAGTRNIYTCEAHNELVKNFLVICYENRVNSAKALLPEIEILQNYKLPQGSV